MMPLPQLLDGLGRGRPEVVQKAFSLHRRAFRLEFLSNLVGGASSLREEHVTRMAILFETIVNYFKKADKNPTFRLTVVNFTLEHIKALVHELESVKVAANSASIQQKKAVLELLNFHQNHFLSLKDQIASIPDAIPHQGRFVTLAHVHSSSAQSVLTQNLSSKTDEEVVRYSLLSSDAVACAKQVLFSRGGRSAAEVTEFFQSVADVFIIELLEKKKIDVAKDVLHNTDRDIWLSLKNICITSFNSNIRDYLALELNSIGLLEPAEIDVWKFLVLVEGSIKNNPDLKICLLEENLKLIKSSTTENQLELSISLLLTLPTSKRASLLSEIYFETLDGTLESMLIKDECWKFLLSNNRLEILIKWICVATQDSNQFHGKIDRLVTFLSSWNVTQEMIDFIPQSECSPVTENCLLDCLSKYGLYTTEESSDIHKLLQRTVRTGQVFEQWSEKIERLLVDLCVDCNMPDLLVSCGIRTDLQSTPWLELYSKCQALKDHIPQKEALRHCLEHSANFLKLTTADDHRLSLASLFLAEQPLCGADGAGEIQSTLDHYPHLLSFLLDRKENESVDISLQLLLKQKFYPGSSHPILKRESLCSMFKDEPEGIEIDFFHEPTMLLHGHNEVLHSQDFLRQGRPCHAAMFVLGEVIRNYGKPSRKLLKRAIVSAHELAFTNMTDQSVVSSCVAFIEMLGESSLTLRTHVGAVKQILIFSEACDDEEDKLSVTEPLLNKFMTKTQSVNAHDIFELLIHCLPLDMSLQGLAVQFARLHKLAIPRNFLVHCARNNDWITFLFFSQIYNYPLDVVKLLARQFQSVSLKEHLESFLSRYPAPGRTLSRSTTESLGHKISQSSMSDVPSSKECEAIPAEVATACLVTSGVKGSLFGVLLACHNCADPAEALLHSCVELPCPILAVLAEFYKVNAEAQLAAWLASWLPNEERINFECWQKNIPWPPEVMESLILRSLEMSRTNLLTGFKIFIPEHPLILVLEVLEEFPHQDVSQSAHALEKFKTCSTFENDQEIISGFWSLSNPLFIFNIGIKVLLNFLEHLSLAHEKRQFLDILSKSSIPLSEDTSLDLSKLLVALDILSNTQVEVNILNYLRNSEEELRLWTDKLLSLEMYKEASELSGNTFVISEQRLKFKRYLDDKYQDFRAFCSDCNLCLEEALVDPFEGFKFYEQCALDLKSNTDRWRALHFALKWLQQSKSNANQHEALTDKVELEMWLCCLERNDVKIYAALAEELQHSPLSSLCSKELLKDSFVLSEVFHSCDALCEEQRCASQLLDTLIEIGDIVSASRVHKFFQLNHQELEILLACIHLAEGKLKVEDIPSTWVSLSALKSTDVNCSPKRENAEYEKLRVLSVIQELSKQLKYGRDVGKQVAACYRLAINMGLPYGSIIAVSEPLKLLRSANFQTGICSSASDIMTALRMSPTERARFLSREIIAAISKGPASGDVKTYRLWGLDIEQHFQQLLELVPDPSLLGSELINMVNKLAPSDKNTPKEVLSTTVELLVYAHNCYAAGCTMEGISQVLRIVNNFAPVLKTRSEWALMVRLLTGIQRYTEMNYIFKMLKENDHFEFLLRKDSVKPLGFKLALLGWLRRECPDDTALLKMTAAHFQMHQQEGELWQKEGNDRLHDVVQQGLQNNQKTKGSLQMAMLDFSHASESYLQADMLNHAMTCAQQAELVALQLHFLSSSSDGSILQVIVLDSKSVAKLIVSTLSFNQALIVARAYNHRTDWAAALFYHCVSPGLSAEEYFLAWSSCMELTPAIVQNISYRLQRTTGVTRDMTSKMQWLLGHVMDMDVRYKIASELGLKDMVESLLQAPEVAYLKDTVWQRGYKR